MMKKNRRSIQIEYVSPVNADELDADELVIRRNFNNLNSKDHLEWSWAHHHRSGISCTRKNCRIKTRATQPRNFHVWSLLDFFKIGSILHRNRYNRGDIIYHSGWTWKYTWVTKSTWKKLCRIPQCFFHISETLNIFDLSNFQQIFFDKSHSTKTFARYLFSNILLILSCTSTYDSFHFNCSTQHFI